jgi:hypothetical protein
MLIFSISFPDLIKFPCFWIPLKGGFEGERRLKDKVTSQIILVFTLTRPQNAPKTFTQGHASVFDKYLH